MKESPFTEEYDLAVYMNALLELEQSIRGTEPSRAGKRQMRKLQRRFGLLQSYVAITCSAVPILRRYHSSPVRVVNRFWSTLDLPGIFVANAYPTVADFFEWYCDSRVIGEDRSAG